MHTKDAGKIIWNYMRMNHELQKSDLIMVLGNSDLRTAHHASSLFLQGLAPFLLCSGSGTIHNHLSRRKKFIGTTEAELFAKIAMENGVPRDRIIIENSSQNTGQNYEFSLERIRKKI